MPRAGRKRLRRERNSITGRKLGSAPNPFYPPIDGSSDDGPGSLRQAILDANTDGVATTINFDPVVFPFLPALPGVILLQMPLPNVTGARGDTIDGTGAGVVLDGSALAAGSVGLTVRRSNNTIRGLT